MTTAVVDNANPTTPPADPAAAPAAVTPPAVETPPVVVPPLPIVETPTTPPAVETPPAATEPEAISYEPTGDTKLDVALAFVGKLGIGLDHPAMKATSTGDFSLLEAHLATLGDKARGWQQMVALGREAFQAHADKATAQATATKAAVEAVAGGAQAWADLKTWATANATADEKAALNTLFDAGPIQARAAAVMIAEAYRKATGTVVNPAPATRDAAASGAANSNGPLDARQYHSEVQALRQKLGRSFETSTEYAQLRSRLRR